MKDCVTCIWGCFFVCYWFVMVFKVGLRLLFYCFCGLFVYFGHFGLGSSCVVDYGEWWFSLIVGDLQCCWLNCFGVGWMLLILCFWCWAALIYFLVLFDCTFLLLLMIIDCLVDCGVVWLCDCLFASGLVFKVWLLLFRRLL